MPLPPCIMCWSNISSEIGLSKVLESTPASWSRGNALVSGAGGLWFSFREGQIGQNVLKEY